MKQGLRLIGMCLLLFSFAHARGQVSQAFADTRLYDAVLDILFQHETVRGVPEVQLRYTYCDVGEMQIVIHKLADSRFRLDIWYVPSSSPNVWKQLAEIAQSRPTLNAETAAKLIKISHETLDTRASPDLTNLLGEADRLSIPVLNQNAIVLDGMAYGIAVRSVSENLNLTLQGPQRADESNSQLIHWMGQIRSIAQRELSKH
ncbi:MAG TPA: hypothetical protein VMD97_05030 [Candidatus Aquilonibacter sp.]|nr:hypothetical protein [Candidatus Aquilonibacter sp.]